MRRQGPRVLFSARAALGKLKAPLERQLDGAVARTENLIRHQKGRADMHESTSAPRAHAYPPRQADLIRAAEQGPAELLRMAAAWIKPTAGIVDTRELRGVAHAAAELERFADEVEEARK